MKKKSASIKDLVEVVPQSYVAPVALGISEAPFTGLARTLECYQQVVSGMTFNNYVIVDLAIVDGVVKTVTKSEPYASFEAIAKKEVLDTYSQQSLEKNFEHGKSWEK
jgi:hypothetical protein